jgi:hypothetical protein
VILRCASINASLPKVDTNQMFNASVSNTIASLADEYPKQLLFIIAEFNSDIATTPLLNIKQDSL